MYVYLYIAQAVSALFMGFVFISRGSKITERLKTAVVVLNGILLLSLLIIAVLERSLIITVIAVMVAILLPGVGQTVTLLVAGRARQISLFSWIVTFLFFMAFLYAMLFGRVIEL